MLEDDMDFQEAGIAIEPPEERGYDTDEDSGEVDGGGTIRFGYKMWSLTTPTGFLIQTEPYQGARGRQTEVPGLGMGGSVVVDLVAELQQEVWIGWTKTSKRTGSPFVPKSGGGHFSLSVWMSASNRLGICTEPHQHLK